jgi:hypothetical protein
LYLKQLGELQSRVESLRTEECFVHDSFDKSVSVAQ